MADIKPGPISVNGQPFYWPNGQTINNVDSTSAAPSACFDDLSAEGLTSYFYLFWKANDPSNRIIFTRSADGQTWPLGQPINDVDSTSAAPSCMGNYLGLFWKANDPSNRIYFGNSPWGQVWNPGAPINDADSTSAAPAALDPAIAIGALGMYGAFWKANDPSNRIYFSYSDGSLPPGRPVNDVDATSAAPAACAFQTEICLFWKANDSSNQIYFSISPDGSTWPPGQPINGVDSTSAAPAACVFQNQIYLLWKANDPSNRIYMTSSADGQNWPLGQPINDVDSTSDSPVACVFQNLLYLFWKANDPSNRICYSVLSPIPD